MHLISLNFTIAYLLTGILLSSLSIFVYTQNKHNELNRTFSLYSLSIGFWCLISVIFLNAQNKEVALWADRVCFIGVIPIPYLFFKFIAIYLNIKNRYNGLFKILRLLTVSFLSVDLLTPGFIKDMSPRYGIKYFTEPGVFYYLFFLYFTVVAGYSIYMIFKEYVREPRFSLRKKELFYFLLANILGYNGGSLNYFLTFKLIPPVVAIIGQYAIAIYVCFVAFIIFKYKFLEIEVIIKKTLIFAGLSALVFAILVLPTLLLQEYIFSNSLQNVFSEVAYFPMKINIFAFSGFLWAFTTLFLTIFIFKFGKTKVHKLWGVFNFMITIWAFGYAMAAISRDIKFADFWWRLAHIGGIVCSVTTLHIVCALGNIKRKFLLIFGYFQAGIFLFLTLGGYSKLDMQYLFNSFYYPKASFYYMRPIGIHFPIFAYLWIFYVVYALCELYIIFKNSTGINRRKISWFFAGEVLGFGGGGFPYFLPVFGIIKYPYWNFAVPLYAILVTYAIFAYQMLDITVIIKRTLIFAGLLAFVFTMLVLPTLIIQEYLVRGTGSMGRLLGLSISGIIIILTMRRLETFLINVTDKYLFQKKYDYKELLKTFTVEVLTIINLDKLVNLTVDKLSDIIKLASSAVLLFDEEKQEFNVMASKGVKDSQVKLVRPDGIVTFLEQTHGYLLKKELIQKKIFIPNSIQEIIDKLNAELIIPMVLHNEVMGILSLGKKKSDEEYTQDDLDILLPLARTLAIAISNAKLFVELGKTQAEAAQNEKMAVIGTLAAGMAHEIRNPMATIKTFAEFLPEKKGDAGFIDKFERLVPREINRIDQIIQHILDFSRPANTAVIEQVDIKEELAEVLEMLGSQMKLENIDFKSELEDIPRISGNRKMMQEVLFNLIQNASHSMKDGGAINVLAENGGNHVILKIKDTGCGIPEDRIRHIFDPFYTTKSDFKNFGLGLFVVRQIMNKLNGKISVESRVGEGTTFTLEFPLAAAQEVKA